ncbi:hypothetical protein CR513_19551, partial [Mucuna pruriens]
MKNDLSTRKVDTTLFHKNYDLYFIIVQVYVDDIIFMRKIFLAYVERILNKYDGKTKKQIDDDIYIHQTKYAKEILKKFKIYDYKNTSTPMYPTTLSGLDELDKKIDQVIYRGMIRFLSYLITSRTDIMFSVCLCARFWSDPRKTFHYFKKNIWIPLTLDCILKNLTNTRLVGYYDIDYARHKKKKKTPINDVVSLEQA